MSIGKRVFEAIERMDRGDPEGASFAICATIEPTAKRTTGKGGRSGCREFIDQSLGLITRVAFGGVSMLNISMAFKPPGAKESPDDMYSMGSIVYHAIRCALYHEAELPASIRLSHDGRMALSDDGVLTLPGALIHGVMVAVVTAPCNARERTPAPVSLNIYDQPVLLDELWGNRAYLERLLDGADRRRTCAITEAPRA